MQSYLILLEMEPVQLTATSPAFIYASNKIVNFTTWEIMDLYHASSN